MKIINKKGKLVSPDRSIKVAQLLAFRRRIDNPKDFFQIALATNSIVINTSFKDTTWLNLTYEFIWKSVTEMIKTDNFVQCDVPN